MPAHVPAVCNLTRLMKMMPECARTGSALVRGTGQPPRTRLDKYFAEYTLWTVAAVLIAHSACVRKTVPRCRSELPMLPPHGSAITKTLIDVDGVIGGDRPFRIQLRITRTQRGWRYLCPRCDRRAAVIYFPPDSVEPTCRVCLRLVYECQYDKLPPWAQGMRYQFERMRSERRAVGVAPRLPTP